MSNTKITIDQTPLELIKRARTLRDNRSTASTPSPLLRDVYLDALEIGLAALETKDRGKRKPS